MRKLIFTVLLLASAFAFADVGMWAHNNDDTTKLQNVYSYLHNLKVTLGTALSFERNVTPTPTGTGYASMASEWKPILVNTNTTGDVTVCTGPSVLKAVRVRNTTNAGVATTNTAGIILVKDGTTVRDGAAAGKTPGAIIYDGADGTQFRTSVILNFAAAGDNPASDGKIEVLCRPMDTQVTF